MNRFTLTLSSSLALSAAIGLVGCAGKFTGGGAIGENQQTGTGLNGVSEETSRASFGLNAEAFDCKDDGDLIIDAVRGKMSYKDHDKDVAFQCRFGESDNAEPSAWVFHNLRIGLFVGEVHNARGSGLGDVADGDDCVVRISDYNEPGTEAISPDQVTVAVCDEASPFETIEAGLLGEFCEDGGPDYYNSGDLINGNIQYHLSNAPRGGICGTEPD